MVSNPPAAARTSAEDLGLDQSRLTHLVGYAASRASIELKKAFARHMAPMQLKAVEFSPPERKVQPFLRKSHMHA